MSDLRTLMIVEDHPFMRAGLKTLIGEISDYILIGEAGTVAEGKNMIQQLHPEYVLLDVSLPDGSGLEILRSYQGQPNAPKFVILTMHKEPQYIARAVEWGASGFVLKDMAPDSLVKTLRKIEQGEKCEMMAFPTGEVEASSARLSPREKKVKDRLVEGKSLTEIGKELGLSVKTISTYRTRILAKLNVKNNAELIRREFAAASNGNAITEPA